MDFPETRKERLAIICQKIVDSCDMSEVKMTNAIGVSRSLLRHWQSGYSTPSLYNILLMSSCSKTSPTMDLIRFMEPELFWNMKPPIGSDLARKALETRVKYLSKREKAIVHFGLKEKNKPLLQYAVADLHTPIGDKQSVAHAIMNAYNYLEQRNQLESIESLVPDKKAFESAIRNGQAAYKNDDMNYFTLRDDYREKYSVRMQLLLRETIGKDKIKIADYLCKSVRTIENWIAGETEPDFLTLCRILEFFEKNVAVELISLFHSGIKDVDIDDVVDDLLEDDLRKLTDHEVRCSLFVLFADHGSLVYPFLQLMLEYMLLPEVVILTISSMIRNNYENAKDRGCLVCPNNVQPIFD